MPITLPRAGGPLAFAAAGVVAVAAAVLVVAGRPGDADHRPGATGQAAAPVIPGPDLAGARRAAERIVIELARLATRQPSERADRLRDLALPAAVDGLRRRLSLTPELEQLTGLGLGAATAAPIVAVAVPLASRLVSPAPVADRSPQPVAVTARPVTAGTVTVQVWAVTVLATGRLGVAVASWSTETVQLAWADQRWLVASYASRSGPVPLASQPQTGLASVLAFAAGVQDSRP